MTFKNFGIVIGLSLSVVSSAYAKPPVDPCAVRNPANPKCFQQEIAALKQQVNQLSSQFSSFVAVPGPTGPQGLQGGQGVQGVQGVQGLKGVSGYEVTDQTVIFNASFPASTANFTLSCANPAKVIVNAALSDVTGNTSFPLPGAATVNPNLLLSSDGKQVSGTANCLPFIGEICNFDFKVRLACIDAE